jgi:hypothetical protein
MNLVAGALAAPVYAWTRNPVAAHNSAVLIALWLSFVFTWALVRGLTGSPAAALVGATAYTFSAYTSAHTPEIQLLMLFGFPLSLLAFHRLAERPTRWGGAALGAALAATALASGYYGVFAGALLALASVLWARTTRAYWEGLAVAVLTAAVLVGPIYYVFRQARASAGAERALEADQIQTYSASWSDYASSTTVASGWLLDKVAAARHRVPVAKEVLFPGFVVAGLALFGFGAGVFDRADRRAALGYAAIGAAAVWASFGPAGHLYTWIAPLLPGSSLLRAPVRMGVIAILACAILASFGVKRLGRRGSGAAVVCLVLVAAESWVPWPLRPMPDLPAAYSLLETLPRGGVVELPFPYIRTDFHQHTKAMMRSMANWQPLVNGYSDLTPDDFYEIAAPINAFPDPASFAIMRSHHVRYVIVRLSDYTVEAYRKAMVDRFPPYDRYLRRLTTDQDVWLYEIVGWPEGGGQ